MKINGLSAFLKALFIIISVSGLIVSCTDDSSPSRPSITAAINGTVTDAETGNAVTGALVAVQPTGRSMITGNDGYYSFEDLDADVYTVSVTKTGYVNNSAVVKAGFGETQTADIQISSRIPELTIDSYLLNFGSTLNTLNLIISNTGVGDLEWTATPSENWISLNTTGGIIHTGSVAVTVKIDRTGMAAGNYSVPLNFTSNANSETVEIFAFVTSSTQPQLTAYPTVMDFTKFGIETAFSIENTGIGTLNWNLTDDSDWLSCSPVNGSTTAESISKVNIYIDRTGLESGIYTGKVNVTSAYGSEEITIIMEASAAPNSAPVIVSMYAEPAEVLLSGTAAVTCIAYDPDAEQITYEWSCSAGSVTGSGQNAEWTAPVYPDSCTVTCTVKDASDSTSCSVTISVTETPNMPPVINSLVSDSYSVMQRGTAVLTCTATDGDGDLLTYTWTCDGGSIGGTGESEIWTAPDTLDSCTVTCTVSDGSLTASGNVKIGVTEAPNLAPVISYLAAEPSSVTAGESATFTCLASDADGDTLSYGWTCDGGSITGTSSSEVWTAPQTAGQYTVTCTVSDGTDTDVENKIINVTETPNGAPVINSLTADIYSVMQNGAVTLTCDAADPDGDDLIYLWTCSDGSISGTGAVEIWTAPGSLDSCTVTCTVSDGYATADASVRIEVTQDVNVPPVITVITAEPVSVLQNGSSTLTCYASDADGDALSYEWTCDGGSITGTSSSEVWTAPDSLGSFTVTCTVSDGTDTDVENKVITVTQVPNSPPVIIFLSADPDTVLVGGTALMTCSATDPEGDQLTYLWSCTQGYISGTDSVETWTAPGTIEPCMITCAVSDGTNTVLRTKTVYIDDVTKSVYGGSFDMGDHFSEGNADELPLHTVTLGDFFIGTYEVTQSEWAKYMPAHTYDYGEGGNYPAYNMSWYEILVYCNKRSTASGLTPCYSIGGTADTDAWGAVPLTADSVWNAAECDWMADGYRLPTEAEWEYVARGGIYNTDDLRYSGSDTAGDVSWYIGNYIPGDFSHSVGEKDPNQLGIFDMSGNVFEWCWDRYGSYTPGSVTDPVGPETGDERVLRGGYWNSSDSECRAAFRTSHLPETGLDYYGGFRIVRKP